MSEQPPQPPQNPYGGSPYPPYGGPGGIPHWAPDHPQATTVLVLGILGLTLCVVCAPFAWVMGSRVKREIEAAPRQYGGNSQVQVGYVLGIVGTCLLGLYVIGGLLYVAIVVAAVSAGA